MIGPMIFVGVGGSGGNTVRAIRDVLYRDLKNRGWTGEFPECWQTLWIDTIADQDKGGFPAPMLPENSYLGLVPGSVGYTSIKTSIVTSIPDNQLQSTLTGWMPESSPVPIEKGAGQYRAIGRTIGVSQLNASKHFLEGAITRMGSTQATTDLARLNQLYGQPASVSSGTQTAFVISSMAGGSGSGLFQDVAHMLKLIDPAYDNFTHVMLYGADVFGLSVPKAMMKSIPGNTLGALAETMNGVWKTTVSDPTSALFTKAAFNATQLKRFGGKHHWLIGAKSNEASLGSTTNEIYAAVGSSLAALAVSPDTLIWLNNYVLTNVFAGSATTSSDKTELKVPGNLDHYQPFAAMGFSRITLGMDRFRTYAAQAITKSAIKRMLWPDYEPLDSNTAMGPAKKIEVRAEQLWEDFLEGSGLYERNPRNDVIDALRPTDESVFSKFAMEVIDKAGGRDAALTAAQWETKILDYFKAGRKDFTRAQILQVADLAAKWSSSIQDQLVGEITNIIATDGYFVAIKLLKRLREVEVKFLVEEELPTDSNRNRTLIEEIRSPITRALGTKTKITRQDSEISEKIKKTLAKGANMLTESDRIDLAIELLKDLDANFLANLQRALEDAAEGLRTSARSADKQKAEGENDVDFSSFPTLEEGTIPSRFAPPNTEQSLIDYKEFPGLLEKYAQDALEGDEKSLWKPRLIERAIKGIAFDPSGDGQQPDFIKIEPRWVPLNSLARSGSGAAQSAGFSFIGDISTLLARTTEMLSFNSGPLSSAINMGIRTYIEDVSNQSLRSKRRDDFEIALVSALKYCTPMVEENPDVLGIVHPGAIAGARNTYFTEIPLENSPLQEKSKQIVLKYDPANMAIAKPGSFSSSTSVKQIEFYSTLTNARNPVVFNSLMDPIASDWNARINDAAERQSFWTLRRTKPLVDSVPISQEGFQKLVTGWFALAFTGGRQIDLGDTNRGPKISVHSLRKGGWVDFPHPLVALPMEYEDHDYLPAVLLSLSLALVRVNEHKSLDPLLAYQTLQESGGNDKNFGYKVLIKNFTEGHGPSVKPELDSVAAREKLKNDISLTITHFQKLFESFDAHRDPFTTPAFFEIRESVMAALTTLRDGTAPAVEETPGVSVFG